jgi:succinate dehydrogenase flavin-adding protein (antitoxin of CptAB toxin-antitoxin module)
MVESFPMRGLRKAAKLLGGEPQVRAFLGVPATDLYRWMRGQEPVPRTIVVRVIELLAETEQRRSR